MTDVREISMEALENMEYRFGIFSDVLQALDTDVLVDLALFIMRMNGDDAELNEDELKQITEYARIHGIEG